MVILRVRIFDKTVMMWLFHLAGAAVLRGMSSVASLHHGFASRYRCTSTNQIDSARAKIRIRSNDHLKHDEKSLRTNSTRLSHPDESFGARCWQPHSARPPKTARIWRRVAHKGSLLECSGSWTARSWQCYFTR